MGLRAERATDELPEGAIRSLEARLRGEIVRPGDDGYDDARRVWNAVVDRHPTFIVRARDVADVMHAVNFTRTNDVALAVRGGGHSPAGYGTVDGGLVVDLSLMKRLEVDAARHVAGAEPGLTWGEYNARTHEHGLATPGGDVAAVGVAGLTLGGGMGWLMRKHGMTIDNLVAVDVVTADGLLVTASETEHPDLFWALRGGGGNFGIATGLWFRLVPVDTVLGGAIVYPATRAGLRAYADATAAAPDELTTITFVQQAPPLPFIPPEAHGTPVHIILPCYTGDLDAGQRALAALRGLAGHTPLADTTGPMPYPALYDLTNMAAASRPHMIRNAYVRDLTDETIEIILDSVQHVTSPFSLVALRELGEPCRVFQSMPLRSPTATRGSTWPPTAPGTMGLRILTSRGPRPSGGRWRRTRPAPTPTSSRTKVRTGSGPLTRRRRTPGWPRSNVLRPRQPLPVEPEHRAGVTIL